MTVFRKLKQLGYHTSYTHRGRYYALDQMVEFDDAGLWSFRAVWFSRFGTLLATAAACVEVSEAGFYASELETDLHVGVQDALRKLTRDGRIAREAVGGKFLYCSTDPATRRKQLQARQIFEADAVLSPIPLGPGFRVLPDELKAAIVLFFSLLDEKQRRLYAGLESLKLGHGGDTAVASLLGLDAGTVARGRHELLVRDVEVERVRKSGAGRPSVEKKLKRSSTESES
jgi:hypothetical protein